MPNSENLPEKPISPEMVIFYMTQDTQRHSLLPELKSGSYLFFLFPGIIRFTCYRLENSSMNRSFQKKSSINRKADFMFVSKLRYNWERRFVTLIIEYQILLFLF